MTIKTKDFTLYDDTIRKSIGEDGTLTITGIANTGERDLVGDVVTEQAINEIVEQAPNRNLHLNHGYDLENTPTGILFPEVVGTITEAEKIAEGASITAVIRPEYVEPLEQILAQGIKLGFSIAGKAHYEDNSYEQIESWDLTEISLTPLPCDMGTMGTVSAKSLNNLIQKLGGEKMAEETPTQVTEEQVIEIINDAFNERKEEFLEKIREELKGEYEATFNEIKERIEAVEAKVDEGKPAEGEEPKPTEGKDPKEEDPKKAEGEGEEPKDPEEEEEEEEKRINDLVNKRVEEILGGVSKNISTKYTNTHIADEGKQSKKGYTPKELAEMLSQ